MALLLPFFILEITLAFEAAVIAVSDPDKNPDNKISKVISNNRNKFEIDIKKLIN